MVCLEAGFAHGADTDTLASMTGGILGAIWGIEWLGNHAAKVQDANCIQNVAEHLARNQGYSQALQANSFTIKKTHLDSFIKQIEVSKSTDTVLIPDGRKAQISACVNHQSISKSTVATSWKLITTDGQSLYVKKLSRHQNNSESNSNLNYLNISEQHVELPPVNVVHIGVEIPVRNMDKSRYFYEKVLGIQVEKESKTLVKCGSIVLISLEDYKKRHGLSSAISKPAITNTIYVVVESFDEAYNNVSKVQAKIVKDISKSSERRHFYCLDPDDNLIKIYEVKF
jgi:predicted enzyme related to lactoylglutathione lyase